MKKRYKCDKCSIEMYKKDTYECQRCGKIFCAKHIYIYVDGNNAAITMHSPNLCEECYNIHYIH